ncbi:MAG: ABC transporter ATP-binding protein, partial [Pseudomonadota bacterium]
PEFVTLSETGKGLPASINAVEDIGRFRIVRARVDAHSVNLLLEEGKPIPTDPHLMFDPKFTKVYSDDHLVRPNVAASGKAA